VFLPHLTIITLFCPLLDDCICRIGVVGEKCGLTVLVLVNAHSIVHILFQLYDVLRFDSILVIGYLSIHHPKVKQPNF